jgi:23S rRNA (cytidine1920-2'-O)/16S rRNA (cytidine1409-2'-O)-methyltransferase
MAKDRVRLDVLLVERGLVETRSKAQAVIMAGEVQVNGVVVDKPGTPCTKDAQIVVNQPPKFVSRGGEKLDGALAHFQFNVQGKIAADVGASTGGFTDCLLQNGASKVYAIDVGYGQIAQKLRDDSRVVLMERTNARYLTALAEPVDLVVIDASFISLRLILPVVIQWLKSDGDVVALIKPQFEAGRSEVGKGGVVRHRETHKQVLSNVLNFATGLGLHVGGLVKSPIKGPAGNIEFLAWLSLAAIPSPIPPDIDSIVEAAL